MQFAKAGDDCEPLQPRHDGDAVGLAAASTRATKPMEVDLSQVLTPRFALRYGDAQSSDLEL